MIKRTCLALALIFILTGCGSSSPDGKSDKATIDELKSSVDDTVREVFPAIAKVVEGKFPTAGGAYTNCGLGSKIRYLARGSLTYPAGRDATADDTAIGEALTSAGFTSTTSENGLKATKGSLTIDVSSDGPVATGGSLRNVSLTSACVHVSRSESDRTTSIPQEMYGPPVTGN